MARIAQTKFSDPAEFLEAAERIVLEEYQTVISSTVPLRQPPPGFLLGLAGGKTPGPLYEKLAASLDLNRTENFLIDERNVSWTDPDSNYSLVRETLYKGRPGLLNKLHDFRTDWPPEKTLNGYADELRSLAPGGFDLLILGAGNDGHFASIFPGFRDFQSREITCRTETEFFPIRERYSLTPFYLWQSRKVLLLLKGKDKEGLLAELESPKLDRVDFPLHFWASHPNLEVLFCEN